MGQPGAGSTTSKQCSRQVAWATSLGSHGSGGGLAVRRCKRQPSQPGKATAAMAAGQHSLQSSRRRSTANHRACTTLHCGRCPPCVPNRVLPSSACPCPQNGKTTIKCPKIQRLVTPQVLQRKRRRAAIKKERISRKKTEVRLASAVCCACYACCDCGAHLAQGDRALRCTLCVYAACACRVPQAAGSGRGVVYHLSPLA